MFTSEKGQTIAALDSVVKMPSKFTAISAIESPVLQTSLWCGGGGDWGRGRKQRWGPCGDLGTHHRQSKTGWLS